MLSSSDIVEFRKSGDIVITPFVESQLRNCSYDVTLGSHFYTEKSTFKPLPDGLAVQLPKVVDPFTAGAADDLWERLEPVNGCIVLQPGQTVLGHTNEFIGTWGKITTKMQARSSIGRYNVSVCLCAGMGDIGYFNRWTLEIKNHSQRHPIELRVGMRIAQVIFEQCRSPPIAEYSGVYTLPKTESHRSYEELEGLWKPQMMLPQRLFVTEPWLGR